MVNDYEVHMGGRTYNPILGRFMQADPFVQAPANLQNYNRYSYVLNNPMSYTDPSGYNFVKKALKTSIKITGTHAALRALAKNKYLNMAVQAGVCFYGGPVACGAYSGAQTFAVTGSLRAGVKSGLITYGTALAFQEIGNQFSDASMSNIGDALGNNGNFSGLVEFGGNLLTGGQVAAQISLHALVGGIGASLQGGNFGHGFFSAGVTKGAGGAWLPGGGNLSGGQVAYGAVVSAVIGGTASVIAGGKFENGAKTAVFQYLYNQASISYRQIVKDVYRTWNEYWATANSLETEMCNKYAGMDCVPLALGVGISGTGAGALVTGSARLAYTSFGLSSTKWLLYDQSAEGLGWLALDAATMGSGAFFRSAGLQGMDHVIGVYSYLFQLPGNFNQQIFPQNNSKCSIPMRCE